VNEDTTDSRQAPARPRIPAALIYACFFGSGLTSLVYELLWVRRLNLVFGSTTYSVTTVLAAFMAGLGLGAYLIGRRLDTGRRGGLRVYAYLELAVALFALLSLPLLHGVEWIYAAAQGAMGLGQGGAALLKFLLAFPVLALPAALMGGTLPALTRALVRRREALHRGVGLLYGVNTIGAAVGTALAGMVLIQHLGLWLSILMCAGINLVIGLAALWAARRVEESPANPAPEKAPAPPDLRRHLRTPAVFYSLVAVTLTGMLSMSYEVIWTRLLTLTMGSSTYAFSIILGIFLLGISAGSLAFSWLSRGNVPSAYALALLLAALAAWVTVSLLVVPHLPAIWLNAGPVVAHSIERILVGQVVLAAALLGVPTLIFGAALPLAMGIVARELGQVGRDVGGIYLCNTAGAILGSVLTGFLLIPLLGTQWSLLLGLLLNLLLAGAGLLLFGPRTSQKLAGLVTVSLLCVAASLQPTWAVKVLDIGVGHRMANNLPSNAWNKLRFLEWGSSRLAFLREGLNATVSVRQFDGGTSLLVNGKADASTDLDMSTQLMLGTIPLLVHPSPSDVAVVGWGSGVTAYTATFFPEVKRVDVIEIEPAVVAASRFFHRVNGAAERLPRVRIHYDDARSYLLATRRRFDVLISEPSNPWMAGVANLFSRDFYRQARGRLKPGGIFGQWLQLYKMDSRSVALVFRTMLESFPHVQVWFTDRDNLILLGSARPLRPSVARVRAAFKADKRLPRYMAAFGTGMLPEQFFGAFLLERTDLERLVLRGGSEVMTDDRPVLEYMAMAGLYKMNHPHWRSLWRLKLQTGKILPPTVDSPPPLGAAVNGAARVLRFRTMAARSVSDWALKQYPDRPFLRLTQARVLEAKGDHVGALKLLDRMPDSAGWSARAALRRCRSLVALGHHREALLALPAMRDFRPQARRLCRLQALIGVGEYDQAWAEIDTLLGMLDRVDDPDLLKLNREVVYKALAKLVQASRQYHRGITAATRRKEQDGGEVSRLDALLQAQMAARVPTGEIVNTLDQLNRFGPNILRHLRLSLRYYGEAGHAAKAEEVACLLRRARVDPVDAPLWPKK